MRKNNKECRSKESLKILILLNLKRCDSFSNWDHINCVNITLSDSQKIQWFQCPMCVILKSVNNASIVSIASMVYYRAYSCRMFTTIFLVLVKKKPDRSQKNQPISNFFYIGENIIFFLSERLSVKGTRESLDTLLSTQTFEMAVFT